MASSPFQYATYQGGHRRGQSGSPALLGQSNDGGKNSSTNSGSTPFMSSDKDHNQVRPSMPISQTVGAQSIPAQTLSVPSPPPLRPMQGARPGGPPPLRTMSSLRSSPSSTTTSLGKGKEVSTNSGRSSNPSSSHRMQSASTPAQTVRRDVSSSLTVPNSSAGTSSLSSMGNSESVAVEGDDTETRPNGHSKRHSYSPSPALLKSSHARSASSGTLPPHLPHHMSTAQRLRSTNTTTTPTQSLSNASSPTGTPRIMSPSLEAMNGRASTSNLPSSSSANDIGRRTAYRPGFQPKGVHRNRTDEFIAAREKRGKGTKASELALLKGEGPNRKELESQRLQRRLEKLVHLYYESTPVSIDSIPTWLPNTLRKTRQLAEEEKRIREEEMRIVKWEEDSKRKVCPLCSTPFSLSIRKHHCRLCGRIVCASPHLSAPQGVDAEKVAPQELSMMNGDGLKCSTLMITEGKGTNIIKDVPKWDSRDRMIESFEGGKRGIRICRECRETILQQQYMLDDGQAPAYLRLYDALISLQREIEQSLPEFQEMVLGLQKQDAAAALGTTEEGGVVDILSFNQSNAQNAETTSLAALKAKNKNSLALQRDAAYARKQLLANFANYDLIAKRIRNLDDEGNPSLARIKMAIWTKANLFLQQNMFPLQSLPKLNSTKESKKKKSQTGTSTPNSSGNVSDADGTGRISRGVQRDGRETDPDNAEAARESISVLEQQLSLVLEYAASASRARKFQDAKSLKSSAQELQAEIDRLRRLDLTGANQAR